MAQGGNRAWRVVGYFGELLLTLGLILFLFAVYLLWWTNVAAGQAAAAASAQVREQWAASSPTPTPSPSPYPTSTAPAPAAQPQVGETIGLVYIPRLRSHVWGLPLVQGVEAAQLAKGIGHYIGTAMPGELGNFATAGHRATNGEPLRNIDQLRKGDVVIVETRNEWFTYELDDWKIVAPQDVWVIDPVPGQPRDTVPTRAIITLTSCHPRWASTERFTWWGHLVGSTDKSSGKVPAELREG